MPESPLSFVLPCIWHFSFIPLCLCLFFLPFICMRAPKSIEADTDRCCCHACELRNIRNQESLSDGRLLQPNQRHRWVYASKYRRKLLGFGPFPTPASSLEWFLADFACLGCPAPRFERSRPWCMVEDAQCERAVCGSIHCQGLPVRAPYCSRHGNTYRTFMSLSLSTALVEGS